MAKKPIQQIEGDTVEVKGTPSSTTLDAAVPETLKKPVVAKKKSKKAVMHYFLVHIMKSN
jgi:hypothetical protein